ncbi:MAG: hypothetical protein IJ756_09955 [Paludibacteraceae bacterium]|nr:hypothetical protein [Paludibacteraceae bacterium]
MKKFYFAVIGCILSMSFLSAQDIPVSLEYTQVYSFVDELIVDGVISRQTTVQPYTRRQIAEMLQEAEGKDSLLSKRQQKDLQFYLNAFALERDTIQKNVVQYSNNRTFNLSLFNPQFSYITKNKKFKMTIEPILGMDLYGSKKGAVIKRWWGVEMRMDIVKHISIWGSLRDISYNGNLLRGKYFTSKPFGARLNQGFDGEVGSRTSALNNEAGTQYKEATYGGDFSDSKGGIKFYAWFGSIGVQRENIRWGNAYHASNILSGRNPAVPQLTIQLTPCRWFQFDYFHAWLVSNVKDSTEFYLENTTSGKSDIEYRPHNKFMAANMFTFTPVKYVSFSFGNSIVYAERNVQAAYFIPFAFFKSLDHLLTKGIASENQNSQAFASVAVYPTDHLKLYGSFFLDEFKFSRLKKSNKEKNPISYLVGFNWSGWPVRGLSLKGEFMRSYIACYTHSIDVLTYESNSFGMGHYMGDNAQSIYLEAAYKPIRGMTVRLSFTHNTKYNSYRYLRVARGEGGKINPEDGVSNAIAQKPFNKAIFRNAEVKAECVYEIFPNMYARASITYNNAQGFDNTTSDLNSELTGTAQYYLNRFCPEFYQGKNLTAMVGLSLGF